MLVQFGDQQLDTENQLGQLRDSSDLLGDMPALQHRMAEDGYLWLRGLIDRDKVADTRAFILQYMAEQQVLVPGEPVLEGVMPKDGRGVGMMGKRGITHDPRVAQTLEANELFTFFDRYFGEAAMTFDYKWLRAVGNEAFTGSHYDIVYMGRGSQRLHTTWIPIGDIPVEQGTLAVCVGSHNLDSFQRLRDTYGRIDVDRSLVSEGWFSSDPLEITNKFGGTWKTANFEMGDVVIFGMYTLHASTTNTTQRFRLSCDVRFQPAADPADERWIGQEPKGHDRQVDPQAKAERISMQQAKAQWGM